MNSSGSNITIVLMILISAMLMLSGCIGGGTTPSRNVENYIFFYPPPSASSVKAVEASLLVERFSSAQMARTGAMLYLPEPYKVDEYVYNRWRLPPGEMVSEFIRRDMRAGGFFQAVFGPGEFDDSVRYRLTGMVEECHEADNEGGSEAVLAVQVTLFENAGKGMQRRIVFQKMYRYSEPMGKASPAALAESMSKAMKRFSEQLSSDISRVVKAAGSQG